MRPLLPLTFLAAVLSACGPAPQPRAWQPAPRTELRVAEGDPGAAGDTLTVSARDARTPVGHFRAGQRVRIRVLDTQWTDQPSATLADARGVPGQRCLPSRGRPCIGGDAPLMGLILLIEPTAQPASAQPASASCALRNRLLIPNGVEFAMPFDAEIALGPNDWEDGCFNNSGAVQVDVEVAQGPKEKAIEHQSISVGAAAPRTFVGRFAQGEYLRVTVTGGNWKNDPGAAAVGSAGLAGQSCGAPGHVCVGSDAGPLMALVMLVSACNGAPPPAATRLSVERRFIPDGADFVLEHDADLFLAPNDREDGLADNSGSARVNVIVSER